MNRSCGDERAQNGLYITVDLSIYGKPLEYFMVCPVTEWRGGQLRSPMLVQDPEGINHVILGVGKQFYPTAPDYIEETRLYGVSKRLPIGFPVEKLTPGMSKLLLVHPRAIPTSYCVEPQECPKGHKDSHRCIKDLYPLSALHENKKHKLKHIDDRTVEIRTPSCSYRVMKPLSSDMPEYSSGIILRFPTFSFEYVNRENNAPKELQNKYEKTGFKLNVVPE